MSAQACDGRRRGLGQGFRSAEVRRNTPRPTTGWSRYADRTRPLRPTERRQRRRRCDRAGQPRPSGRSAAGLARAAVRPRRDRAGRPRRRGGAGPWRGYLGGADQPAPSADRGVAGADRAGRFARQFQPGSRAGGARARAAGIRNVFPQHDSATPRPSHCPAVDLRHRLGLVSR